MSGSYVVCIVLQSLVTAYLTILIYHNYCSSLFVLDDSILVSTSQPARSDLTPHLEITLPMNGMYVYLNKHFSLFNIRLTSLHVCYICSKFASWSLPSASKPAIRISLAMQNIGYVNEQSVNFILGDSFGAALNGSLI